MAVLDNLSGFEFEDVVEDVFRNLGYENVRQADRRTDEGRDVLMEEDLDPKDDLYPIELIDGKKSQRDRRRCWARSLQRTDRDPL